MGFPGFTAVMLLGLTGLVKLPGCKACANDADCDFLGNELCCKATSTCYTAFSCDEAVSGCPGRGSIDYGPGTPPLPNGTCGLDTVWTPGVGPNLSDRCTDTEVEALGQHADTISLKCFISNNGNECAISSSEDDGLGAAINGEGLGATILVCTGESPAGSPPDDGGTCGGEDEDEEEGGGRRRLVWRHLAQQGQADCTAEDERIQKIFHTNIKWADGNKTLKFYKEAENAEGEGSIANTQNPGCPVRKACHTKGLDKMLNAFNKASKDGDPDSLKSITIGSGADARAGHGKPSGSRNTNKDDGAGLARSLDITNYNGNYMGILYPDQAVQGIVELIADLPDPDAGKTDSYYIGLPRGPYSIPCQQHCGADNGDRCDPALSAQPEVGPPSCCRLRAVEQLYTACSSATCSPGNKCVTAQCPAANCAAYTDYTTYGLNGSKLPLWAAKTDSQCPCLKSQYEELSEDQAVARAQNNLERFLSNQFNEQSAPVNMIIDSGYRALLKKAVKLAKARNIIVEFGADALDHTHIQSDAQHDKECSPGCG